MPGANCIIIGFTIPGFNPRGIIPGGAAPPGCCFIISRCICCICCICCIICEHHRTVVSSEQSRSATSRGVGRERRGTASHGEWGVTRGVAGAIACCCASAGAASPVPFCSGVSIASAVGSQLGGLGLGVDCAVVAVDRCAGEATCVPSCYSVRTVHRDPMPILHLHCVCLDGTSSGSIGDTSVYFGGCPTLYIYDLYIGSGTARKWPGRETGRTMAPGT